MKKFLLILLLIIVVVVGGFLIYVAVQPNDYKVERSTTIDAPIGQVFAYASDLKTQPEWSPWAKIDSAMTYEMSESTNTVGATYSWNSEHPQVGTGSLETTELVENESVKQTLKFTAPWQSESLVYILFEETEEGTKVTWGNEGSFNFGGKMGVTMAGGMEKMLGPSFEEGLVNLKSNLEAMPEEAAATFEVEVIENTSTAFYSVKREEMNMATDMNHELFAGMYGEIGAFMGKNGVEPTGPAFAIYHKWDMENGIFSVEGAMPVAETGKESGNILAGTTHEGMVAKTSYKGTEDGTAPHDAIYTYIMENNYQIVGAPWEVYTNYTDGMDMAELITDVYYPIAPADAEAAE